MLRLSTKGSSASFSAVSFCCVVASAGEPSTWLRMPKCEITVVASATVARHTAIRPSVSSLAMYCVQRVSRLVAMLASSSVVSPLVRRYLRRRRRRRRFRCESTS